MDSSPYQPPKSAVVSSAQQQRAKSPKVTGIILIVIGVLSSLSMILTLAMLMYGGDKIIAIFEKQGLGIPYAYTTIVLGLLGSVLSVVIGILLVKYKDRGRRLFNYYMIYLLVSMPLFLIYENYKRPANIDFSTTFSSLAASLVGLLIYGIVWYYLNKENTKASLD